MRVIFIVLLLASLTACEVSTGGSNQDSNNNNNSSTNTNIDSNNSDASSGTNEVCSGAMGIDGSLGFLWKPESESDGKLAVLFPKQFERQFLSVLVEVVETGEQESLTFSSISEGRQVWRGSLPGGDYTGKVVADNGNSECVWIVTDPSIRQD